MLQGIKEFVCGANPLFQSCHASSVAVTADGTVLCVWFAGSKEGADDVNIWGSRRVNGAWESPKVLAQGGLPHWNPVLCASPNGTVLLFYKVGRKIASWQTWVMESGDGGVSWCQPRELVPGDEGGRGPVRNKILILSNGRWLAPASLEDGEWRCFADFSDDSGKTWHKSHEIHADFTRRRLAAPAQAVDKVAQPQNRAAVLLPALAALANFGHIQQVCSLICGACRLVLHDFLTPGCFSTHSRGRLAAPAGKSIPVSEQSFSGRGVIQPTLWETGGGAVSMLMRSSEGFLYRSDSENYGADWAPAYPTELPNNNSGIDLVRVPDGRLFLVCNPVGDNWGARYPLKILCSADGGISWREAFTLEKGPGEYSYPAIIFHRGKLLVTYTSRRKNIAFWELAIPQKTFSSEASI